MAHRQRREIALNSLLGQIVHSTFDPKAPRSMVLHGPDVKVFHLSHFVFPCPLHRRVNDSRPLISPDSKDVST